jgi:hypothetical protein
MKTIHDMEEFAQEIESYFYPTFEKIRAGQDMIINFNQGTASADPSFLADFLSTVADDPYVYNSLHELIFVTDVAYYVAAGTLCVAYVTYDKEHSEFITVWA